MPDAGRGPLPRVTLKWAQTLDGRTAAGTGHSQWISGPAARVVAHQLRADHDAVLVGVSTILADDPQLTTRLVPGRDPLRVILDRHLRTPPGAAAVRAGTVVVTSSDASTERERALLRRGADVVRVPVSDDSHEMAEALGTLSARSVSSVLVEGGSTVISSFLRARLADEMVIVIAPTILGAGLDAVGPLAMEGSAGRIEFEDIRYEPADGDVIFRGRPIWPS